MVMQILLGPQDPLTNLKQDIYTIDPDGSVVCITAGWRDSEGEIEELQDIAGRPVEDLKLYQRAESVFAKEAGLRE